jgi:hypothetical protein
MKSLIRNLVNAMVAISRLIRISYRETKIVKAQQNNSMHYLYTISTYTATTDNREEIKRIITGQLSTM